jgi:hypothetical protein
LGTELDRERDRRAAVRLDHQDLQQVADHLIVEWYRQQQMFNCAMRRVMELELRLMLAEAEPSDRHLQMARELQADLGIF